MGDPSLSALDRITDKVIAYRPPNKQPTKKQKAAAKAAKKRGKADV